MGRGRIYMRTVCPPMGRVAGRVGGTRHNIDPLRTAQYIRPNFVPKWKGRNLGTWSASGCREGRE